MSSAPADGHLTIRERRTLLDLTSATPLSPSSLTWEPYPAEQFGAVHIGPGCAIRYSEQMFALRRQAGGRFDIICVPNPDIHPDDALTATEWRGRVVDFGGLAKRYQQWIHALLIEPPVDPWARYHQEEWADTEERDNSGFSEDEQRRLTAKLSELEQKVASQPDLTDHQRGVVRKAFEYLREGLPRLGRFDWRQNLYGTLFQMGLQRLFGASFWVTHVVPFLVDIIVPLTLPQAPPPPRLGR